MKEKSPRGRKPWITPPEKDGGADLKAKLAKIGQLAMFTDVEREIMATMNISHETWYNAKKKYPEFNDVLETSWQSTILKVKASLLKKALDGDFNAQKLVLERKAGWKEESRIDHKGIPTAAPTIIRLNLPPKKPI